MWIVERKWVENLDVGKITYHINNKVICINKLLKYMCRINQCGKLNF